MKDQPHSIRSEKVGIFRSKEIASYQVPVNPTRLAESREEAKDIAESLGFRLAMKIASPDRRGERRPMTDDQADRQRRVLDAMARPAFYTRAGQTVEGIVARLETHISVVFLIGEYAYKVKKPVALGFLDFGTLEQRRRFCEEEVSLNRRLAPDVYEGVFPITRGDAGPEWNGEGETMEYAVLMKRLPADRTLPEMRKRGADDLDRLAEVLAGVSARFRWREE